MGDRTVNFLAMGVHGQGRLSLIYVGREGRYTGGPGRRTRFKMSRGDQEDIQVVSWGLSRLKPEAKVNTSVFSDTAGHCGVACGYGSVQKSWTNRMTQITREGQAGGGGVRAWLRKIRPRGNGKDDFGVVG